VVATDGFLFVSVHDQVETTHIDIIVHRENVTFQSPIYKCDTVILMFLFTKFGGQIHTRGFWQRGEYNPNFIYLFTYIPFLGTHLQVRPVSGFRTVYPQC